MNIAQIKEELFKKATIFTTGGVRPTKEMGESWIGAVLWQGEEEIPSNFEPIFMVFLKDLPYVPNELKHFKLFTVYMDFELYNHLGEDNLMPYFKINCYENLDDLLKIDARSTRIKPFPLIPSLIANDAPAWDSHDISSEIEDEIIKMECAEDIEYYDDIVEEIYSMHKIGGYPSFTQGGVSFGANYPFVFQISSDEKAQFNIVDSGSFYFFYNPNNKDWIVHCDFY